MTTRFQAEEILVAAASGIFPNTGETLIRTDSGWIFGVPGLTEGGALIPPEAIASLPFSKITGTIFDLQMTLSAVKQFEAFLAIAFTQLTGQIANAQVPASAVIQWCDEILKCEPFNLILARATGQIENDRIPASAVTQFCDEILKCEPFNFILRRATSRRAWSSSDRLAANGALA